MKTTMYLSYPIRSLARGGQRTLLAIFCVAVGVMAVVALQLVGGMVNASLTGNVREGNGGDLSLNSPIAPITAQQLSSFDALVSKGTITSYTAVSAHDGQSPNARGNAQIFQLRVVDPQRFPLVGQPIFDAPSNGSFATLLSGDRVIVTKNTLQQLNAHVGERISVTSDDGRTLKVTVGGVIENAGNFTRPQMLISYADYQAVPSTSGLPVDYTNIYATVKGASDANAATAKSAVAKLFPLATITTTKDALQQSQSSVQTIRYFLQIVGLLALLIGGVGIINTMQVLLRRRRTEIAMLKTTGYRQRDLYALFGIETGILGLIGGVLGAGAGVGVSFLVKNLVERLFLFHLPVLIDPVIVASGVAIGFSTALIFGLMPIVQASQVRPLAVLREMTDGAGVGGVFLSIGLALLLAALFFVLALTILGNLGVALGAVVGTGVFLLLLSLLFSLILFIVSHAPVRDDVQWWHIALLLVAGGAIAALLRVAAPFGWAALGVAAVWALVTFAPRSWKATLRLSLRNIGRQRARTVTTMVALFVGVFSIGLVLTLGQNIKDTVSSTLSAQTTYNAYLIAGAQDQAAVNQQLGHVQGLQAHTVNPYTTDIPLAINGTPVAQALRVDGGSAHGGGGFGAGDGPLRDLASVQGYALATGQAPNVKLTRGAQDSAIGTGLTARDAGTNNLILPVADSQAPLKLKLGDTITLGSQDHKASVTFTITGFYTGSAISFASAYADTAATNQLGDNAPFAIYSLKIAPSQADQALHTIQQAVPTVRTISLNDITLFVDSLLTNITQLLTAIASLAMAASVIIIANSVALAMVERQRELGILKAVGYTSGRVLSGVLLENALVGLLGAALAMTVATVATGAMSQVVFNVAYTLSGGGALVLAEVIGATALVCMLVAGAVSWRATRVRPLEVLRYE